MPGESGLALLEAVKVRFPDMPVIIMTAFSDLDSAVATFQRGAFEYLTKPFDVTEAVQLIQRAVAENQQLSDGAQISAAALSEMLGQAPAMQEVFRAIGWLPHSNVTVPITSESGNWQGVGCARLAQALIQSNRSICCHQHCRHSKRFAGK